MHSVSGNSKSGIAGARASDMMRRWAQRGFVLDLHQLDARAVKYVNKQRALIIC